MTVYPVLFLGYADFSPGIKMNFWSDLESTPLILVRLCPRIFQLGRKKGKKKIEEGKSPLTGLQQHLKEVEEQIIKERT